MKTNNKWSGQLPLLIAPNLGRYDKVKPLERKCKSTSREKESKSRSARRTKRENNDNTTYVNDIDSYTIVDDHSKASNKELFREKSVSGQKFFRRKHLKYRPPDLRTYPKQDSWITKA